jgi:hypothetical protein
MWQWRQKWAVLLWISIPLAENETPNRGWATGRMRLRERVLSDGALFIAKLNTELFPMIYPALSTAHHYVQA